MDKPDIQQLLQMIQRKEITPEEGIKRFKAQPLTEAPAGDDRSVGDVLYCTEVWRNRELVHTEQFSGEQRHILLFDLNTDRYGQLKKLIQAHSRSGSRASLVIPGADYQELENGVYHIRPDRQEDYERLFQTLRGQHALPCTVLHLWSQINDAPAQAGLGSEAPGDSLELQLERGLYSLFFIGKAWTSTKQRIPVKLIYVHSSGPEGAQPAYAAVGGMIKSVRKEQPDWIWKTIEVQSGREDEAGSNADPDRLLEVAWQEAEETAPAAADIRYCGTVRQVRTFTEITLSDEVIRHSPLPLKNEGVYLITGGLGGLGHIIAGSLAERLQHPRLVLSGRSPLGDKGREIIAGLERRGASVIYYQSDVSDRAQAEQLIAMIKAQWQRLDGVIHCAGVNRDALLRHKTAADMESVLAAKVYGTLHLDEATAGDALDLFVLFSSIAGIAGNAGQADYAFGNSYMDHYASRRSQQRGGRSLSLNWPQWAEGGMQPSAEEQALLKAAAGLEALPALLGLRAWETALRLDGAQLAVLYGDRQRLTGLLASQYEVQHEAQPLQQSAREVRQPAVEGKQAESVSSMLTTQIEKLLKELFGQLIKLPAARLDLDTTFQDYGVDSVMVKRFNDLLEQKLGPVSATLLFEYRTLRELAASLAESHSLPLAELFGLHANPEDATTINIEAAVHRKESKGEQGTEQTAKQQAEPVQPARQRPATPAVQEQPGSTTAQIAIIGVSGRYPQAGDLSAFWDNLKEGKDCVGEIPAERWDYHDYYDPDPQASLKGKMYCKWGGFVEDAERFDSLFFNISPKEAGIMDPQERLFLETVWSTLEDAGYTREEIARHTLERKLPGVGVFAGVTTNSYQLWGPEQLEQGAASLSTSFPWSIANRISYYFDFTGPSVPVDTACSSSLTAIHMACESLVKGESSMAIAGGVNLYLHPLKYIVPSQKGMLSASGKCSSFGADADGYVPGEGVGAVLLKPLAQAQQDGDYIYGVIKGTAINHGGASNGYTVPSLAAQVELIRDTLKKADIDPRSISYIEAHGTGTALGDPIEVNALTKAYGEYTQDRQYCSIGSAKSNIGHLEAAAGIAGLTKVLLQMKHGQLVPSLHAEHTNPNIRFEESPFYVQQELEDWLPVLDEGGIMTRIPRRAGISSFGAGGSNAHIIVEEYLAPELPLHTGHEIQAMHIVPLSARNEDRLLDYAQRLLHFLEQNNTGAPGDENKNGTVLLERLAYTLQTCREPMEARVVLLTGSLKDLSGKLQAYIRGDIYGEGIWQGKVRHSALSMLPQDEDMTGLLHSWAQKGKLDRIAGYWVNGGAVDWQGLSGKTLKKLPLPAYPFAGERYWLPQKNSSPKRLQLRTQELHPLVHTNISTLQEHKYATSLVDKQPLIYGNGCLSGFAFLEAGLAAGRLASRQNIRSIRNIKWSERTLHNEGIQEMQIRIYPAGEELQYEVAMKEELDEEAVLSQGLLLLSTSSTAYSGSAASIDLSEIRQRCGKEWIGGECYDMLQIAGVNYEAAYRSIQHIAVGRNEALAQFSLPEEHLQPVHNHFTLQPVLMDGILQSIAVLLGAEDDNPVVVCAPQHLGYLEVMDTLGDSCMAYVTKSSAEAPDAQSNDSVFDVQLTTADGRLLLRLEQLQVRRAEGSSSTVQPAGTEPAAPSLLCCTEAWVERKLDITAQTSGEPEHVLLFDLGTSGYQYLKSRLLTEQRQLSLVIPGTSYQELGNGIYQVRPDQPEDYASLFRALKSQHVWPVTILHLWSCTDSENGQPSEEESLQWQLQRSLYSLFSIGQTWLRQEAGSKAAKLIYMHNFHGEAAQPAYAAMSGMIKSVRLEQPGWLWKTVGVRSESEAATGYTTGSHVTAEGPRLLDIAWQEAEERSPVYTDIRYEGTLRQTRVFTEVSAETEGAARSLPVKDGGIYLITGGLGGLGRMISSSIAGLVQRPKLALSGRSRLQEEDSRFIRGLERQGAEVLYVQGDISDKKQTEALLAEIRTHWGQLNGVIHCAGVNRDALLQRKTAAEIEAVLAAKVQGTLHLDEATAGDGLELFVLFSSIAGIAGNRGQSDYAYGNSFMDHFAKARALRSTGRTLTLNWPLWEEGGMQLQVHEKAMLRAVSGLEPLPTAAGLKAWERALRMDGSQYAIFYGDRERIIGLLEGTQAVSVEGIHKRTTPSLKTAAAATASVQLREQAEQLLRSIFGEVIGMAAGKIDIHTHFQDYGVDSIMVKQFNTMLEQKLGAVPATLLFEYRTISELAGYVAAHHSSLFAAAAPAVTHSTSGSNGGWQKLSPVRDQPWSSAERIPEQQLSFRSGQGSRTGDVAIIGISGRYPQAAGLGEFWENLKAGQNSISEIPGDRWDCQAYFAADRDELPEGKMYCKWGGFVEGVERFDPLFFNISPREAENMDPQERLFIETVWSTLEDAGYTRGGISQSIREKKLPGVGVFAGITTNSYQLLGPQEWSKGNMITPSSFPWSIANRISYLFDFSGPSIPVDTACSSSLTAIHLACESLSKGECSMAVAGGVNLYLHPMKYVMASQLGMLSAKGQCSSFGAEADGYVPGEGVGAVLLKPLDQAERDGDYIYAVIKGTSINHGGATNGYTVPSLSAQAELIKDAVHRAGIDPRTISYIEAHGTGTVLGDPIEINALTKAFREFTADSQYCAIGSAKSNIGHLEAAAGIAGLTKVLLQMKHKQLVPTLHADVINPNIRFEQTPFYLQRQLADWQPVLNQDGAAYSIPRRAGISSFGAGGANAHIIVEEYNNDRQVEEGSSAQNAPFYIVPLSARNTETLQVYTRKLADFVDHHLNGSSTGSEACDRNEAGSNPSGIITELLQITKDIFGIEQGDLHSDEPVAEYSSDPLVLSEWLSRISRTFRRELDHTILDHYPSIQALGEYLYSTGNAAARPLEDIRPEAAPSIKQAAVSPVALDMLAYTLQTGREAMACRVAVVVRSLEELSAALHAYSNGVPSASVHSGGPLTAGSTAETLFKGSIGELVTSELIKGQKFAELAQLWAANVNLDWNKLYTHKPPHKLPLPSYPFSGSRYWVEISGEAANRGEITGVMNKKPANPASGNGTTLGASSSKPSSRSEGLLFYPGWTAAPLTANPGRPETAALQAQPRHVVIVSAQQGAQLGTALADAHSSDHVLQLMMGGPAFPRTAGGQTGAYRGIDPADPTAFEHCISTLHQIDLLYFININSAPEAGKQAPEGVMPSQEEGVMALFRLFKALDKFGFAEEEIQVKVITNNVCAVNPAEAVIPDGGSIHGFMYSMTKEFSNLGISCVDVDLAELDLAASSTSARQQLTDAIRNEPPHPVGKVTALRRQQRFIPAMFPLSLPDIAETPFRPKGVYFILGGAGGIGMELAKFLARKVNARLVLVGRREQGSEHLQKIKEIEACGGEAIYLSADATSPDSMRNAVASAKSHFGSIHGVVHSAIVLQDKTLPGMDEAAFRKALAPKVQGSVVLAQAFEEEALDFMLFFSSAQSFTGNPGQSNYAAGCTFKDAYAQYLRSNRSYPVITYNWGFWGTVGVVAYDSYQERFASQGVGSIEPEEGMFVVEQALACRTGQVVPLKADDQVLEIFGVELNRQIGLSSVEVPSMLGRWKEEEEQVLTEFISQTAHTKPASIAATQFVNWYVQERLKKRPQEPIRILSIGAEPDPQLRQLVLSGMPAVEYSCSELKDILEENSNWDVILWNGHSLEANELRDWLQRIKRLLKRNGVFTLFFASGFSAVHISEWMQALQHAGMNTVLSQAEPHLLVGESDGLSFTARSRTAAPPDNTVAGRTERQTAPIQSRQHIAVEDLSIKELATGYVKNVFAEVLKLNKADIDPKVSFEQFGVDSIMVMELNRHFRKDLGKLPSTLLYEHATVEQLASYLEQEHAGKLLQISGALETAPRPDPSRAEIAASGVPLEETQHGEFAADEAATEEGPRHAVTANEVLAGSAASGESEVDSLVDELSDEEVDALLERLLKHG